MEKKFLQFRNWKTEERSTAIDVTGKSERQIERITRGMLINMHEDWFVGEYTEAELSPTPAPERGE